MQAVNRDEFAALLESTRIKPRLKRELRFVPEEITNWENRDFIAAMNKSRSEGVLVASLNKHYVVPFQLQARKPNISGRIEPVICDICMTWQRGSNSSVITFTKSNSTVSFLCCGDLNCSLHVRNLTKVAALSRTQLREDITIERRVERLKTRLTDILSNLK